MPSNNYPLRTKYTREAHSTLFYSHAIAGKIFQISHHFLFLQKSYDSYIYIFDIALTCNVQQILKPHATAVNARQLNHRVEKNFPELWMRSCVLNTCVNMYEV